jgi:hypothetical protein
LSSASQPSFWHRLTGWVAIYALVLQGLLAGLAMPPLAGDLPLGHELCLSDPDGSAASELPVKQDGKIHCPLCLAGAHQVLAPAPILVPSLVLSPADDPFWPARHQVVARTFELSYKRSRAPPATA